MSGSDAKFVLITGWMAAYMLRMLLLKLSIPGGDTADRTNPKPIWLSPLFGLIGRYIIPAVYLLTPWFNFADCPLPGWANWMGAAAFSGALWLLWRSHTDLAANWTVAARNNQYDQHPLYITYWVWGIAQALLLQNWIAGLSGLALVLPFYLVRFAREGWLTIKSHSETCRAYAARLERTAPRLSRDSVQ